MTDIQIADFQNPTHASAIVYLLNEYDVNISVKNLEYQRVDETAAAERDLWQKLRTLTG